MPQAEEEVGVRMGRPLALGSSCPAEAAMLAEEAAAK